MRLKNQLFLQTGPLGESVPAKCQDRTTVLAGKTAKNKTNHQINSSKLQELLT